MLRCKHAGVRRCGAVDPSVLLTSGVRTRFLVSPAPNTIPAMTTVLRRGVATTPARLYSSTSMPWIAGRASSHCFATQQQHPLQQPRLPSTSASGIRSGGGLAQNGGQVRHYYGSGRISDGDMDADAAKKMKRHDALGFAKRISQMLDRDRFPRALTLVINAEKSGLDCMVAWNMLLDSKMKRGEAVEAFKLFNDMKKRGRKPNAQTFTIMLRGCAKSQSARATDIAMTVYKSLFAHNSLIKPSTIHHNAALEVCARHNKMDSFWSVVGNLPDEGYGAPDNITFTTILNAIRANTQNEIEKISGEDERMLIRAKKTEAVKEGKRIWADVIRQWRQGTFMVDGRLISAMGRLLLFSGREQDYLDIFSLFLQGMGIPRNGPKHTQAHVDALNRAKLNHTPRRKEESQENEEPEEEMSEEEEFRNLFEPVTLSKIRENMEARIGGSLPEVQYPLPSNAELSLIMETCSHLKSGLPICRKYWERLTDRGGEFVVKPDAESCHEYLRLLRVTRSSYDSVRIVCDEMAPQKITARKTFIITMSTCARDRYNPNIVDIAGELVALMSKSLRLPEPKVLLQYMSLVRKFTDDLLAKPDADPKRKFEKIVSSLDGALKRLKPSIDILERVVVQAPAKTKSPRKEIEEPKRDEEEEVDLHDEEDEKPKRVVPRRAPRPDWVDPSDAIASLQTYHLLLQRLFARGVEPWASKEIIETWKEEDNRLRVFLAKFQSSAQRNTRAPRATEPEGESTPLTRDSGHY